VIAAKNIDTRADQYSLGAMLFHMLTGRVPFEGLNNNAVMQMHVEMPLRDPRTLVSRLNPDAVRIVLKLMAKKPDERYAQTGQVVEDLEDVLQGRPPRHAPPLPLLQGTRLGCQPLIFFTIALFSVIIWLGS
jgi:serine/threonine-protein kinase